MPKPPGIFQLIQREGNVDWEEMFQDFNCGIGLDVVGENTQIFRECIDHASQKSGIAVTELGKTYAYEGDGNKVVLKTPYGEFGDY